MSRSSEGIVLTLLGGAVLGGLAYGVARKEAPQPHLRNQYANLEDCNCAYSNAQCSYDGQVGHWVGPWYLRNAEARRNAAYDPGPGTQCGSRNSGHGATYRGPINTEQSMRSTRSGFGSRSGGYMG